MSAEQFRTLRELAELFEQGLAKPHHIEQLSQLLSLINQRLDSFELLSDKTVLALKQQG